MKYRRRLRQTPLLAEANRRVGSVSGRASRSGRQNPLSGQTKRRCCVLDDGVESGAALIRPLVGHSKDN